MNKIDLYSYSLPRAFSGLNIPIAVQSTYLREYAIKNNYNFVLPKVEWCIPGVYTTLYSMIDDSCISEIAFTSINMIPIANKGLLEYLNSKKKKYHFVLEKIIVNEDKINSIISDIRYLKGLSQTRERGLI